MFAFDNAETHTWAPIATMFGTSAMEVRLRFFRNNPSYESTAQYVRVRKYKAERRAEKLPYWVHF